MFQVFRSCSKREGMFLVTQNTSVPYVCFEKADERAFILGGELFSSFRALLESLNDVEGAREVVRILHDWFTRKSLGYNAYFDLDLIKQLDPYELEWGFEEVKKKLNIDIEYCGVSHIGQFIGVFDNIMDTPNEEGIIITQIPSVVSF